jgi:hypothetical protein
MLQYLRLQKRKYQEKIDATQVNELEMQHAYMHKT